MMKNTIIIALMVLISLTGTIQAAAYKEITPWSTIVNGNGSKSHYSSVSDGTNTYHLLSLGDSPAITKVDGNGNVETLVSTARWAAATARTSMTGFGNFSIDGDNIRFADSGTDSVWNVNKITGQLTSLAGSSAIRAYTGLTSVQLTAPGTAYNNNFYFYEGKSDSVLKVDGAGIISTFISDTQLSGVAGNDTVSGSLTFDSSGNTIWASNSSDSMYSWNSSTQSGTELLSAAVITSLTGKTSASFGDFFYAPDGNIYFYEIKSDSIMSFDPADAADSLDFVLTKAELLAGPGAYDNVFGLTWHDDNLAFNFMGERGFYAVPEPATVLLSGLGGLALIKRKKTR